MSRKKHVKMGRKTDGWTVGKWTDDGELVKEWLSVWIEE